MRGFCVAVVALGILAGAETAAACTIRETTPEEAVRAADAAVFGRIVSRVRTDRGRDDGLPGKTYRYRLRVLETCKGSVRDVITLIANTDSASCGVGPYRPGVHLGLLLNGRRGPWRISLGSLISRESLRTARRAKREERDRGGSAPDRPSPRTAPR